MSKFNKVTAVMAEHIFRTGIEAGLFEDDVCDFATANVFAAAALKGFWKFLSLDEQETQETQRPNAIAAYTRAQAIEGGVLVDVSETAHAIELTLPVAVTAAVWSLIETLALFQDDVNARLLEMLSMVQWMVNATPGDVETLYFTTCFTALHPHKIEKHALFKMVIKPGEHRELVITIMLPDENVRCPKNV